MSDSRKSSSSRQAPLREGVDYYLDELGRYVFLTGYHLRRGYCCRSRCRHCPYGYGAGLPDPDLPGSNKQEGQDQQ